MKAQNKKTTFGAYLAFKFFLRSLVVIFAIKVEIPAIGGCYFVNLVLKMNRSIIKFYVSNWFYAVTHIKDIFFHKVYLI